LTQGSFRVMLQTEGGEMKKIAVIIAIAALVLLGLYSGVFCAQGGHSGGGHSGGGHSQGGHYGGGHYYHGGGPRVFIGGYFGFPYYTYPYGYYRYGYPYYYPYPYTYPYPNYPSTYVEPPVYLEPEQPSYWYYCRDSQAYYPYVTSCPSGWTKVVPTPPPPREEGEVR
jgi:hypothetical protein